MPIPGRRSLVRGFALATTLVLHVGAAAAQDLRIDVRDVPLPAALAIVERQAAVTVIFADRLVAGRRATCRYEGDSVPDALACVLTGSGLVARESADRQYVLSAGRRVETRPLAGFVRDARTGEPLPGAHVVLPEPGIGLATSTAGFFSFAALEPGEHRVRVSFIGFAVLDTVLVTRPGPHFLSLEPRAIQTEDVIVETAASQRADLTLVPGLVNVPVSRLQQLPSSLGGQDLLEALKWLPGISRTSEVTGGLVVRGSGPDQNLYLVDGAPVYHPWHAFSLVSTFETESFRQIRLYRGSFPAEFGGRLSSVLDAELSDGRRTEPRAVASMSVLAARFLVESPITSTSSFMLAGRRSFIDRLIGRTHPVSDPSGRVDTLRTGYFFYDWSAKVALRPDKDSRFTASYYLAGDDLDLRLPFDLSLDRNSWMRPADLLFEVDEAWRNALVSLRFERLLAADWFLSANGYDVRYAADEGAFVQPSRTADVTSDYSVRLRDVGVSVDADHYRSLEHQLRAGASIVRRSFDSSVAALISYAPGVTDEIEQDTGSDAFEFSAYGQDVWRPEPRLHLVTGLRITHFSGGPFTRLSPRLSAQYAFHPSRLVVQAAVSRNNQFIHRVRDRHSFLYDLVSSRWVPSSRDVSPADGDQVALSVESRPGAGLEVRAGLYARRASGVLLPDDAFQDKDGLAGPGIETATLLSQYVSGEERSRGFEWETTLDRPDWLASIAYTWSEAENRQRDATSRWYRSRYDVPHALDVLLRRKGGAFSGSVSLSWRSGNVLTVPVARYFLEDPGGGPPTGYLYRPDLNNGRLPPYLRFDVELSYRFSGLGADWLVRAQIYNLFSRRNVVSRLYEPDELAVRQRDRRGLPRIPLLEVRMEL